MDHSDKCAFSSDHRIDPKLQIITVLYTIINARSNRMRRQLNMLSEIINEKCHTFYVQERFYVKPNEQSIRHGHTYTKYAVRF